MPEAGDVFPGGISKRHLTSHDDPGLELFVRETRRAELAHWWALGAGPILLLWNPPLALVLLVGYGVGVNLPFIVVQRHNRARALTTLRRRRAVAGRTAAQVPAPGSYDPAPATVPARPRPCRTPNHLS